MSQLSGKYAEALVDSCNILEFESWSLEYGADIHETAARSGGGARQTVEGVFGGSGSITGYIDPDDPLTSQLTTGALVTLTLHLTSTGPVAATGSARLGAWSMGASRDGTPIQVSIPFTTHGLWTLP